MSNVKLNRFNYIGIDPGTNTGIAIITAENFEIKEVKTINLNLKTHFLSDGTKMRRYEILRDYLVDVFKTYKPYRVAREQVFKGRFANAHAELTRLALMIDFAKQDYSQDVELCTYSPTTVKSYFANTGKADKDAMRDAFKRNKDLKIFYKEDLTEHEIDAFAIAYLAYKGEKNEEEDN